MGDPVAASGPDAAARRNRTIAGCAALAALYFVGGVAGLQFPFFHSSATTVWPPSGIALAALLLFGVRLVPGVFMGAVAVNLWITGNFAGAIGVGIGNTVAALTGYWVLHRLLQFDAAMGRLRDISALLLAGAIGSTVIAATLSPLALLAAGAITAAEYPRVWFVWWLGDMLGVMLFTPLVLAWYRQPRAIAAGEWQAALLVVVQALCAFVIFHGLIGGLLNTQRATYALLPLAIWLAVSYPLRFTAVANLAVFFIAITETALGRGPFTAGEPLTNALLLHLYLVVVSFTTYLVCGVNAERIAATEAAHENAQRFRHLSDLSADWYWEQDDQFRFTWRAGRGLEGLGFRLDEGIGTTRWELDVEDMTEADWAAHKADLLAHRPFADFVIKRRNPDGEVVFISLSGEPVLDAEGRFLGYRGIGKDVTAQEFARRSLIHSEQRLKLQIENMPIACITHDPSFVVTDWNPAAERIFGYTREEMLGRSPFEYLIPAAERGNVTGRLLNIKHTRDSVSGINENLTRDGRTIMCRWQNTPLFGADGQFVGFLAMAEDVTAVHHAEQALRRSEERFRRLTELSSDWYWEQDAGFRFTYISPRYSSRTGLAMRSPLGQTRFGIDNIWVSDAQKEAHQAVLEAHQAFHDLRLSRVNELGELHHLSLSGEPVFDQAGRFLGYRGIGRDISTEVAAERRVARLRDFYAALSEANNAIIHTGDQQALFEEVCKIAVTHGHLRFARICLIDPATGWIENAAIAGEHFGYCTSARVSASPDVPEGRGPTGDALRSGTPYVDNNIATNPRNALWLPLLQAAGVMSSAVYPLRRGGRVVGSLHLYAGERHWFDDELAALIHELATNISFALDNIEREAARRSAEKALRESEQRFRDIAYAAGEFVWESDIDGFFTYVSPRVVDFTGYTAEELVGREAMEFIPESERVRISEWLAANMRPDRSFRGLEHRVVTKAGQVLWMQVSAVSTWDDQGNPRGHRGTARDITAMKESEARISYLATRDPLTELPNRLLLNDRLDQGIINARRNGEMLAMLFIDLDRFKNINDSLGHHVGDQLLKEVSALMASCIRKGDTLARLGGDEFVVTLEGLAQAEDAAQVARKIHAALGRPVSVAGHSLITTCSIGISIFPNDAEDGRELMRNADTAMYHAKESGRNKFRFFAPEMNVRAVELHQMEIELRQALENGEFLLHYQPQADLKTGELVGMEALIRWRHPERGLVPPLTFIPVAEETGLIEPIGRWALRAACRQARAWQEAGFPPLKVAVNISARQLDNPAGFADEVATILAGTGLDAHYLELEVTESMLLKNVAENVAVLRRLGEIGVRMTVDDFGTGYSSLAYLKQLPIDSLKIDRTFVRDIETDADDAAIIQAIIAMAHGLDLRVIAEGVETEGQAAALRRLDCDEFQGYLLARPLDPASFSADLFERPASPGKRRA